MSFTTFSGPVRTGTVKNTTGTTVGAICNTGVISLVQSANLALASSVVAVLPAGSQIVDIIIDVTTTYTTGSTLAVGDGITTNKYVNAITSAATGRQIIAFSGTQLTAINNIGTSDVAVTVTMAGTTAVAGSGFISIVYAQKTSSGAEVPASA